MTLNNIGCKMIDKHLNKILVFFLIIFAIEGAILCWRMPKEFRSEIIPKLERVAVSKEWAQEFSYRLRNLENHTHRYYDGRVNQGEENEK